MADPMRIRAQAAGDKTTVRVLMAHEMEGGQRKDAAGKIVPATMRPDQSILVCLSGRGDKDIGTVADLDGAQVFDRPSMQGHVVKGAKAGDKIAVNWKDNKGDTRSDEATVS